MEEEEDNEVKVTGIKPEGPYDEISTAYGELTTPSSTETGVSRPSNIVLLEVGCVVIWLLGVGSFFLLQGLDLSLTSIKLFSGTLEVIAFALGIVCASLGYLKSETGVLITGVIVFVLSLLTILFMIVW